MDLIKGYDKFLDPRDQPEPTEGEATEQEILDEWNDRLDEAIAAQDLRQRCELLGDLNDEIIREKKNFDWLYNEAATLQEIVDAQMCAAQDALGDEWE